MIFSQSAKYRLGSEPMHVIIASLNLNVQVEYVQDVAFYTELKNLINLAKNDEKFKQYFSSSLESLELVKPFYSIVKLYIIQGQEVVGALLEQCTNFQNLISNNQFQFLSGDLLLSVGDLLLIECLEMINTLFPHLLYNSYQSLYQYAARVQSTTILQSYYFSVDFMMKDFAPTVKNFNREVLAIIKPNLSTFHDFAQCQGILYRYKEEGKQFPDNCPISLFPLFINYGIIEDLKRKTVLQQKMIAKMGNSFAWYSGILGRLAKFDEFINRMIFIQDQVEHCVNKCVIFFKKNSPTPSVLFETIFSIMPRQINGFNFGFISDRVQKYHSLLFDSYYKGISQNYGVKVKQDFNHNLMVEALHKACQLYNKKGAIVLIITAEFEGNVYDQRYIEKGLAKLGVISKRTTFLRLIGNITIENGVLKAFGEEIALVYFRTGYTFDQYENEECWSIREMIELSRAIKCPSLNTQLVNFKKLQQILLDDQQISKFLSKEEATYIKENYCKIWGFDDIEEHEQLIEMIRKSPHDYVLKPQREGGGNNFYDDQIIPEIERLTPEQRNEFIVMERIKPLPRIGFMMRRGQLDIQTVISEISVIGYFISEGESIIVNEVGGYLVRTKRYLDNEGGVAAGYAVVDSFMVADN